jgi:8-oxo-dGTP diphosphatase
MAAIRELEEETSIQASITDLTFLGTLDFQFPFNPSWNQVVYIFLLEKWLGKEKESVEIKPKWFKTDMIPYDKMWKDASYWLPEILQKRKIDATFSFKENNETVANHEIRIIE